MPSYYLRYFYAHDAVLAEQRDRDAAGGDGRRDRARAARAVPRPRLDTKPALLEQRGGAFYSEAATALLAALVRATGRCTCSTSATAARCRAGRRRRRRGARAGGPRAAPVALPQAPLAPEVLGLVQHVAAYERLAAARGGRPGPRRRPPRAARPPAHRPDRPRRRAERAAARAGGERGVNLLAVDGGNWKTHVALVRDDGEVLALARGPELAASRRRGRVRRGHRVRSSTTSAATPGCRRDDGPVAEVAEVMLAGADLPAEERRLQDVVAAARLGARARRRQRHLRRPARGHRARLGRRRRVRRGHQLRRRRARRPAGALPRAGRDHGRLGRRLRRRPRRRSRRRPAAPTAAARGPRSSAPCGALRHGGAGRGRRGDPPARLAGRRLVELAPVALALAADDAVAGEISDRLAAEVVAFARRRARAARAGGRRGRRRARRRAAARPGTRGCSRRIERGLAAVAPRAEIRLAADPPIVGAALLASTRPGGRRAARARTARSSAPRSHERRGRPAPRHGRGRARRSSTMAEVRYEQATRVYPGNRAPAVDALDLDIADGELMVLVGPSGSGKTTALRALAGLEEVDAGAVLDRRRRRHRHRAEATATSRWSSRTTRCTRTSTSRRTSRSR